MSFTKLIARLLFSAEADSILEITNKKDGVNTNIIIFGSTNLDPYVSTNNASRNNKKFFEFYNFKNQAVVNTGAFLYGMPYGQCFDDNPLYKSQNHRIQNYNTVAATGTTYHLLHHASCIWVHLQ